MLYTEIKTHSYSVNKATAEVGYVLAYSCEAAGELPSKNIFAYNIGDPNDPAADSFSHVVTVHEIQNVEVSRDAAIAAGASIYFLTYAELNYSDLTVALQARLQLDTRINGLTRGWVTFRDDFATEEVTKLYPSSDPEVEEQAIQDYVDARDTRQEAETTANLADVAVTTAQADIDNASEFIVIYEAQLGYLEQSNVEFTAYVGLITTEGGAASGYRTGTILLTYSAEWSAVTGKIQQWKNTKVQREQAYSAAVQGKIAADAELAAAQAAEDESLAVAVAANPDWDPSSV
jgi:hypothetical protein